MTRLPTKRTLALAGLLLAIGASYLCFFRDTQSTGSDQPTGAGEQAWSWQQALVDRGSGRGKDGRHRLDPIASNFGPSEAVPRDLRQRIAENLNGIDALGLKFDTAQHVPLPQRTAFWLVVGRGVTCIFQEAPPASACDTSSHVDRRGLYIETYDPGQPPAMDPSDFVVVGVAPDRTEAVRAEIAGRPLAIPVTSNTFEHHADQAVRILLPRL